MTYRRRALEATLILLAAAPLSAAAQEANEPYLRAMEENTAKRRVNPAKSTDKDLDCLRIRAELARLDRQLAGGMGALRTRADEEHMARPAEVEERRLLAAARDAANSVAPMGTAPGNLIEATGLEAIKRKRDLQMIDNVMLAAKSANDFNFIAARIPYLHKLAEERCTAEDLGDEGKVGK